jgi:hypothetical protein
VCSIGTEQRANTRGRVSLSRWMQSNRRTFEATTSSVRPRFSVLGYPTAVYEGRNRALACDLLGAFYIVNARASLSERLQIGRLFERRPCVLLECNVTTHQPTQTLMICGWLIVDQNDQRKAVCASRHGKNRDE